MTDLHTDLCDALALGRLTLAELALIPNDELEAVFALASEYLDTQRDADAATLCAGLVTLSPYNAKYWRAYGIALHRLAELREARVAYDIALVLDPRAVAIYCDRGEVQLYLGNIEAARADLERAAHSGVPETERRSRDLLALLERLASALTPEPEQPATPARTDTSRFVLADGRALPLSKSSFDTSPNTTVPQLLDEPTTRTAQLAPARLRPPPSVLRERGTDTALLPGRGKQREVTRTAVTRRRDGELVLVDEPTEV
ncbi:MAG: hypothetical protein AAB426_06870 [Myxococcota bacterium]